MVIWKISAELFTPANSKQSQLYGEYMFRKQLISAVWLEWSSFSLLALTAYNIGEKFNHNILFDATIFIISLVMLILTFAIFRKAMAGLFTTTSSSTTNKQVQSECSQESSHQNANQDPVEEEQISDSLERYESILVEEQLGWRVKRKGTS